MSKTTHQRRGEVLLLPECLDDYVGADNPVRALDEYVESLDMGRLGFDIKAEGSAGRPAEYRPQTLLKLLAYGYLNQIRSSRKLEKQTKINLEVIWLTEKAQPDHWTINDFRKRNSKAFKQVLRNFHKVCDVLGLFGKELLAGDGSFFKALNNKSRNFTEAKLDKMEAKIDAAIEAYDRALEEEAAVKGPAPKNQPGSDTEPDAGGAAEQLRAKKEKISGLREAAHAGESGQVSLTDPDSRLLKKGSRSVVGHNVQCGVDGKNGLVAHIGIAQAGNDTNQLEDLARETCAALDIEPGEDCPVDFVADTGYENHGQMERLENDHVRVHVPVKTTTAVATPGYRTDEDFHHDPATDEYVCPQGERLKRHADTVRKEIVYRTYYNTAACRDCPVRGECTKGKFRKLNIGQYKELTEKVAARMEAEPEIYARRKEVVELPFGTMKSVWGYGQFMVTGKEGCEGELNMTAFCFNWKRALNLVGMERLLEAIALVSSLFRPLGKLVLGLEGVFEADRALLRCIRRFFQKTTASPGAAAIG